MGDHPFASHQTHPLSLSSSSSTLGCCVVAMPPDRSFSLVRLPARAATRALTELDNLTEGSSPASLKTLLRSSVPSSASSSSPRRPSVHPYRRTRSLPNEMAIRRSAGLSRAGSKTGRVSRRGSRTSGPVRRAHTWTVSGLAPSTLGPAAVPLQPLQLRLAAPSVPPRPTAGPSSPQQPETLLHPFSPDSSQSSPRVADETPPITRPVLLRPPRAPQKPKPDKNNAGLDVVRIAPLVAVESEEDKIRRERQRQHALETERSRTRLQLMLGREKIYRDELEAMEVDTQRVDAECGIEPAEHETQVGWLFKVTPNPNIDPALYDHLADCPDTRFLAVLLFARLVSLTVFYAVDDPTSADERRRESNIAQAALSCLMIASKLNHDILPPLYPFTPKGFRSLLRRHQYLSDADLWSLEMHTLHTLSYRVLPSTPSDLLSELPLALPTLADAIDHLEPDLWHRILVPSAEASIKILLHDFSHSLFPLSLLLCVLIWTDLREIMRDELGTLAEAEERACETWAEMNEVVGGPAGWEGEKELMRRARGWVGRKLGW